MGREKTDLLKTYFHKHIDKNVEISILDVTIQDWEIQKKENIHLNSVSYA
jgi:hypothetical protein